MWRSANQAVSNYNARRQRNIEAWGQTIAYLHRKGRTGNGPGPVPRKQHELLEDQWQGQVKDLALACGWKYYHTRDSRRSDVGFPDTILVRPPRLIVAELKREGKMPTLEQYEWLRVFAMIESVESYWWTPNQLEEVKEVLR
jgi:hypothetical protein